METVESLKSYPALGKALAGCSDKETKSKNLGDHVNAIFDHIIIHCPEEALGKLEEISYLLKHEDTVAIDKFLNVNRIPIYSKPADDITKKVTTEAIKSSKDYFKVSEPKILLIISIYLFRSKWNKMKMAMLLQKQRVSLET